MKNDSPSPLSNSGGKRERRKISRKREREIINLGEIRP
jgi:hypothetical protein